ncbi:hypothetical protein [Natrinema ejinorense]|uniref:Uncharacterized protein n=1 Tax=Natrinema ejinorense TaxID=373386 RepID=A0A2A5QPE2_9EURY|nr:hypothetical protein [Natrinema ejinorense]PCR88655.1 hypothetical protein CP557_21730 [Natrinema ejinorense]
MPATIELEGDAHDLLTAYQRDDEDLSETAARVLPALVPHPVNFEDAGVDADQLDTETRFVLERWPTGDDGTIRPFVYSSKTHYLRANKTVIEHTNLESGTEVDA